LQTSPQYLVWPPAKSIDVNGAPVALSPSFRISSNVDSLVHTAAIDRYAAKVADATTGPTADDANAIESMEINVLDADETLGLETKYDYTLRVSGGRATVNASSIYGAQYAMDSFWQLLDPTTGRLAHSELTISDSPDYAWRGLMIDSGRRFFPLPLVKNLMDTMAGNKMNVLHLHASDMCRFGVESKAFPNLTAALTGIHGGFYTHADIADMVKYGSDRGIRVVPEFDIPGHSRGFIPIESDGATFCTDEASRSQLYGDPGGKTYQVVHTLLREMAGLFPDEVFNIGCDETGVKGPCTQDSTFALERKVLQAIETEFNKTAEGWEEVLFDAGAATNKTIVNAWARHKVRSITGRETALLHCKTLQIVYWTLSLPVHCKTLTRGHAATRRPPSRPRGGARWRALPATSTSRRPVPAGRKAGRAAGTTSPPTCLRRRSRCCWAGRSRCGATPTATPASAARAAAPPSAPSSSRRRWTPSSGGPSGV
jgi:hexosaminidase